MDVDRYITDEAVEVACIARYIARKSGYSPHARPRWEAEIPPVVRAVISYVAPLIRADVLREAALHLRSLSFSDAAQLLGHLADEAVAHGRR